MKKLGFSNITLLMDIDKKGQLGMQNTDCHSGVRTLERRGYVSKGSGLRKSVQWRITNKGKEYLKWLFS